MDNPTILIVDDESMTLDILEGYLTPDGYHLIRTKNGIKALEYLTQNYADLVLLDVMMPHMDGFTVCEHIKKKWPHIPIILITSFWDKEQKQRGRNAGADSFLLKPIDKNQLRRRIRSMLNKNRE